MQCPRGDDQRCRTAVLTTLPGTNACYARWDDSRKVWGDIINKCRTLVRQANTFMGDEYASMVT